MTSIDDKTHRIKWLSSFHFQHICLHARFHRAHADAHQDTRAKAGTLNDGIIIGVAVFYLPVAEDRILSSKRLHFFQTARHWLQQVVCFSLSRSDWMIEVSIISPLKGWWTHAGSVTALFPHSSMHINQEMLQMRGRASGFEMSKKSQKNLDWWNKQHPWVRFHFIF